MATLTSNVPPCPLAQKWEKHKFTTKLINPANKRKYKIIVVGAGLAGSSAAATLAELGYEVHNLCSTIPLVARTRLQRRAASTPQRIIRTTATASIASFMTP
jgi:NAD(P)H-nitrite reductase large subunit